MARVASLTQPSGRKFFPDHAFNGKIVFGLSRLEKTGDQLFSAADFYDNLNQARCQHARRHNVKFTLMRDEYGCVLIRDE